MNTGDTSGLKDEKKMDSNKVWQWRIMHAKKYSICPEPFHYSNEIGLTFNVASNTQKKLDLDLLTNGVILEVCDFAKTVIKGKGHFITQILENNFDLGLENEQQRVDFTTQILHKVKDLIRKPPENKHEVFMILDKPSNLECTNNSNNGLHVACTEGKTDSFPVETDDTDDGEEEDGFNYSKPTSKEYMAENLSDSESNESKHKCSGPEATTELKEVLPFSFPYCEEIGLSFDNGSKQSLDIGLLTKGVMLELVHFARVLTASYNRIILDVLEHNFELDLKNEQVKNQVLFKVLHLLKRRKQLNINGNETEFKNEPFAFQTNPFKGPRGSSLSNVQEKSPLLSEQGPEEHRQGQSKHMETNTFSHKTTSCTSRRTEGDHSDTYAREESALDSDKQGHVKHPKYTDVPRVSDLTTDISSIFSLVNTIGNPPFETQPDKRGFCGDEEETHTPRNGLNKSDIEQEEMGTEHKMWKLRSNRIKQILSPLTKDFGQFNKSKTVGLEYNVGFGPKQNISVESLKDPLLLEIGSFAVAMNSSQKDFIMEILEYNFDLNLPSQHHRNIFASDIMTRVRQLRSCGDAVKFSNEVFKLPSPSINMMAQSVDGVSPELTSRSRMGKCDVAPVCPPDSHAETKEHISHRNGDLYPLCKEMGLNLHVNNSQPNKKLEINKLTNGAMTEVANFAEKLCGTFEQICVDILRHNLDFDLQRDSELAKNIFARIFALKEQRNLSVFPKTYKNIKLTTNDVSTMEKQDCPDNPNLNTCSVGSSQAAVIDQNVGSSADTKHQNDLDLKMWKLRANHIQRILSMPHKGHCPLYSYSRCKKLGIDFNVGSGIKQNLDPKFLTNGIMFELDTFATALSSAQKYFLIEILEHNFDLNFENELSRSAFADKVLAKITKRGMFKGRLIKRTSLSKKPFEFPDVRCVEQPSYAKTLHCPKCYQDQKVHEDDSDPGHMHHTRPHTMSDTVSADVKCTTQKRAKDVSSVFSTTEKTIMDSNPHCKKIGLNLCVDKDLPKNKLDMHILTNAVMMEVVQFAKKLCGTNYAVINNVLEHNFNLGKQSLDLNPALLFSGERSRNDGGPAWYNKVFDIQSYSSRPPGRVSKVKQESALRRSERMEIIKEGQLALQTKQERANMPSGSGENPYPACTVIGLNLGVKEESGKKVKLDLKLLTRAVVFEIHKFATLEAVNYYSRTVFDILDYNFDLSSQHYRRWDFSTATALKIQTMVKEFCRKDDNTEDADEVFKLPFMFDPKTSQQQEKRQNNKNVNSSMDNATESNSSCVDVHAHFLSSANMLSSLPTVNLNVTSKIGNQADERGFCGDEEQTQTPRNAPKDCDMEQEVIRMESYTTCPLGEPDLESDEVSDSENTGKQDHLQDPQSFFPSTDIVSELESSCMGIHAPFFTSINHQSDIEQEEVGTEHNMWKLRSNRVEQILSALTKDFGYFSRSKRFGLEYNVGFGPKQNISVESLKNSLLLEIGKFAVTMNLSQKDFIMEILEYNFDLNLPSQHHRNIFASDIMTRVRQLRSCGDAVKFSNEVFELPGLVASIYMTAESEGGVNPEMGMSKMRKCDVAPVCPPDSHAEIKEHISYRSGDLYPLCKEIGLNLHVNNSQPNKKLQISKLTNGAMTEVANFAERLCGTFEEICLDILKHNLDFDFQRDSELAKNILAKIPVLIDRRNKSVLSTFHRNMKLTMNDASTMEKQDCPDSPNLNTCSAGSSQAAVIDQNVGGSADMEHQNDLDLKMWKLRANRIQQILSMPHQEHCPLYSYSRCRKLGIDFNIGSGVKQNLDPKLLTNGIMVELNTFATELNSAKKHFIMEVLEYNFDLNFENELYRTAFAKQILKKIGFKKGQSKIDRFELPDTRCIQEPIHGKILPCPKCYQDRNQGVLKDKSDPVYMHHPHPSTMTGTDSTDVNCTAQQPTEDPSSTFFTAEELIMEGYPLCKEIGLNLCVDKNKPKNKLDTHILTYGILNELASFARKLCAIKSKVIIDVLEHNFNTGMLHQPLNPVDMYIAEKKVTDPDWFNEVFVHPTTSKRPRKLKRAPAIQKSNCLESIKKRRLANHTICYPLCSEIGLDLDVTSKSEEKEKLDLKLLTTAVVAEIHKYASNKLRRYYPGTVFDILDYNFDLSSQHYRCLEFSIAIASKIKTMVKKYHKNKVGAHEIFKLPFVFAPQKRKRTKSSQGEPEKKRTEGSCVHQVGHHSDANHFSLLSGVQTEEETCSHDEDTQSSTDHWTMDIQNSGLVSLGCGSPLWENIQIKKEVYDPHYGNIEPEEVTEETYHPQHVDMKTDIPRESESRLLVGCATFPTPTNVSSTLPTTNTNVNLPFTRGTDGELCGSEGQTETPRNVLDKCDMKQVETAHNMWKLRANRVEQILPTLKSEHSAFFLSDKISLEFNVGFGQKQKIGVGFLTDGVLLEIAKFALAMNSSQKDFIMEILEYNFDLNLPSQHHRNIFASDIMTRVRKMRSCGDAIKSSNEVFKLPSPSINMMAQSVDGVSPELTSRSRMEKVNVSPVCPPDSHAETKERISCRIGDLYPLCKEMGLNLHVNNSQPNKKHEINKLTNGVMAEVANFAEKLCGTFDQICFDILRHNLDFDLQRDSELAKNIFARIPALIERSKLSMFPKIYKLAMNTSTMEKQDCPDNLNLNTCSAGSSQAAVIDQNVGSSADTEHQNDLNLKIWKLRANRIQRTLSMPHKEHCPLYSYSRCKELGIDFNVGSGITQKLDPKFLTNGIMIELNTFATALSSDPKYFITEILEHNFDLNFENELSRSAFADDLWYKIRSRKLHKSGFSSRQHIMKKPFELPDVRCIEEPSYGNTQHCSKCYEVQKFHENESDSCHMHHPCPRTMSDTVSADVKCTTQKHAKDMSSVFSTTEKTIMDRNPHCKKIGLNLCVDKDLPRDKLDMRVLTNSVMRELVKFAKKICGKISLIITDVIEHNFNISMSHYHLSATEILAPKKVTGPDDWLDEVFVLNRPRQLRQAPVILKSNCLESIKKRQMALQTKQERANMPSGSGENPYPACTVIGLDLDVTSNSGEKVILDLKLLTRAVVFEIHKFATLEAVNYYPRTVFDILDYNFDLRSQHYRRWEFSIATALKIQTMVKDYCQKDDNTEDADEVFKLPFMFDPETSQQRVEKKQDIKGTNSSMDTATESNSSCVHIDTHFLTSANMLSSLPTVNSNVTSKIGNQPDEKRFYGDEEQTHTPGNAPNDCDMEQEEIRTENYYTCPLGESDLESDEVSYSENTGKQDHLQNPQSFFPSTDIVSELKPSCVHAPFFPSINHQSDIEQEEMGTEHNMWKLRSNRVEQILSALTKNGKPKNFCQFNRSKRFGLEYNVGFGPKQNFSVESSMDSLLYEIGKFAVTMNSSQKDFIMDILEYNFDLNLPSQHHRNIFASDIMTRVRQLRSCGDAVKFSNEVFKLPGLVASIYMTAESEGGVNPEMGMSKMGKCDVAPVCPPDSHAETKEHISCRSGDLYPLCKEIGLNLHVNNSQPNKKLQISKLTNGAMTEVANFAERLCGTFEQICFDILRHNLDFDLQRDSEFAKNILAKIPVLIDRRNKSVLSKFHKNMKLTMNDASTMEKRDCPDNPNLDTCSAGSSQAAVVDQNVGSSADTEHLNDLDLKIWKLRANRIQQILSMPHKEHCPLYSYSRCKKLGIDFNVGSGIKQNLDPKFLTNGIMIELNTFATALSSASKYFITEILEHNFDLHFENELSRISFATQLMTSKGQWKINCLRFKLPDTRCIPEPICGTLLPCPKCYQDRNQEVLKDKSDPVHMHHPHPSTMTGTDSTDVNCTAQQPTEDPSCTAEERIMEGYPLCKEIGLNLCVDKNKPKNKLDTHILTYGILNELASFARKLCAIKSKVIIDVLEHNFNTGMLHQPLNPVDMYIGDKKVTDPDWFNEVFVLNRPRQLKQAPVIQKSNCLESIKNRRLALQLSQGQSQDQRQGQSVVKSKHTNYSISFPLCSEIGLDLDVTSESVEKEKLDLKVLTTAVVVEIHKFACQKRRCYYPRSVFDILDYNFDLSSQHHRRLEFSIATASKLQSIAKRYHKNRDRPDEVFKLPFVFEEVEKTKRKKKEKPVMKRTSCVRKVGYRSDVNHISLLSGVQTEEEPCSHDEDTKSSADHWMMNMQNPGLERTGCGSPLQENIQLKKEEYDPHYDKLEHVNVKTESITGGVEHLLPYEPPGSLGNTVNQDHLKNSTSTDIPRESESRLLVGCATFPTPINVSSTLLTANIQNPGLVHAGCGNPLQENIQIKNEESDPHYVTQEPDTEEKYHPQHVDVKAESNICDDEQLIPCEPAGSLGYAGITTHPNSESIVKTESENDCFTESHVKIELDIPGINLVIIDESYENMFI